MTANCRDMNGAPDANGLQPFEGSLLPDDQIRTRQNGPRETGRICQIDVRVRLLYITLRQGVSRCQRQIAAYKSEGPPQTSRHEIPAKGNRKQGD